MQGPLPFISQKTISGIRGQTRQFFSYATDYIPPASGTGLWKSTPGAVNENAVAASPDAQALEEAFWGTYELVNAARLDAGGSDFLTRAERIVQSVFTGDAAMPPNMTYARVIPQGSLEMFDTNELGFEAMNDMPLVFSQAATAAVGSSTAAALAKWAQCAPAIIRL